MSITPGPILLAAAAAASSLLLFGAGIATADEMDPMPPPQPEPVGPIQGELDSAFDQIIEEAEQAQIQQDIAVAEGQMEDAVIEMFLIPPGAPIPPECTPVPEHYQMGPLYFFCGGPMPMTNPPVFVPGIGGP
jgi:hypothetical protein